MYVFDNIRNPFDSVNNTNTLNIAEQISQKKESAFNKPEISSTLEQEQIKKNKKQDGAFIAYFTKLAENKNLSNRFIWSGSCDFLKLHKGNTLKFSDIDPELCCGFKEF